VSSNSFEQSADKKTCCGRLAASYKRAALLFVNILVVFVILNLVTWAAIATWHRVAKDDDKISHGYSAADLRIVYPNLTDAQRTTLLTEVWGRPMIYAPFMEVKEQPISGTYVNVTDEGYRVTSPQGPWPIDPKNYNIFVFGNSTAFGYGVADNQTIASYLQTRIADANASDSARKTYVYNFGTFSYCSTQERIQFEQFLQAGIKPDLAIFIDGLADFSDASGVLPYTAQLTQAMDSHDRTARELLDVVTLLPIGRGARHFIFNSGPAASMKADTAHLSQVIDKYVWNKTTIERMATEAGVSTLFVFQPVPMYKYDLTCHLFKGDGITWDRHINGFEGYPLMAKYVAEHPMGNDFLWLADMQEGKHQPLYCDQVDYTPEFSDEIAAEIQKFLAAQKPAH
jgi:hypothetical protein